jgi:hypothetical protein
MSKVMKYLFITKSTSIGVSNLQGLLEYKEMKGCCYVSGIFIGHWYNSIRGWKPLVQMRSIVQSA